jgi:hypothetical protein
MAGSVNKAALAAMYEGGQSIPQISARTGINRSRVRQTLIDAGVTLRPRAVGMRMRADAIGDALRGRTREFSDEWKANIAAGRKKWGAENGRGTSLKANGYVVYTQGEHKDRAVHDVLMEERLGRRLMPDECVHHIDRNRSNNDPNNLALVTRSGHMRLHRFEDRLEGVERIANVRVA